MALHSSPTHEQLISLWCALADYSTRKQRTAAHSPAALVNYWQRQGRPALPARCHQHLQSWLADGGQVLFRWSADYPESLAHIPDSPAALFVRGEVSVLARPCVAIVGSRAASHSGLEVARTLAAELSQLGVLVVSGLAQGIDCAAHQGALGAGHSTLAIPGSGLGNLYPRKHRQIAQQILHGGGLLASEYAPWVSPRKSSFPARNRIISGICSGVVVVQAALRSGSLITARLAAEQGREVMAVPGTPGLPVTQGCNQLLRDGAALVEAAGDVLDALGWSLNPAKPATETASTAGTALGPGATPLARELQRVVDRLDFHAMSAERLGAELGLTPSALDAYLLELQLRGLVQATPRGYIRAP